MKRYSGNRIAFLDLLTNTLLLFIMLFAISFLQIKPDVDSKVKKPKAEYIITITWDPSNVDDVDIWTKDPLENVIFFRKPSIGLVHLDRDDLGYIADTVVLPDGTTIKFPYNQEIVTIRGIIPGEWIFNVHMYSKRETNPTVVSVRIDKVNPTVKTIFYKTVELKQLGDEITVFRGTMDRNGVFKDIGDTQQSLTEGILQRVVGHYIINERH